MRKIHRLYVPILFQPKVESTIDEGGEAGIKAQWTVDPEFVTEFCDLTVPKGGQAANMIDRRKSLERRQGQSHRSRIAPSL